MARKKNVDAEAPAHGARYNVIRRDFLGDKGKQVGCNVSKDRAEEYVKEMQEAGEQGDFQIVKA